MEVLEKVSLKCKLQLLGSKNQIMGYVHMLLLTMSCSRALVKNFKLIHFMNVHIFMHAYDIDEIMQN